MTFAAFCFPQTVILSKTPGGWSSTDSLTGTTAHHTDEQTRAKVDAMEAAGWRFNDARADGFPF